MEQVKQIQQWMQYVISSKGKLVPKINKAAEHFQFDENDLVKNQFGAPPLARLNIYARGYQLRLLECLQADYSILTKFLGEELFNHFALLYLENYPSKSYSLFDLGKDFPDFLKRIRPEDKSEMNIPFELARLERARVVAYRNKGIEEVEKPSFELMSVFGMSNNIKVIQTSCLQLLSQSFDFIPLVQAYENEEELPAPEFREIQLAVSRANYRISIIPLEEWQYQFLQACEKEIFVNDALKEAAKKCGVPTSELIAKSGFWLPIAFSSGYLTEVESSK